MGYFDTVPQPQDAPLPPEREVLRGWIKNLLANGDMPTCDMVAAEGLESYVHALARCPFDQHYNECAKLAELDKPELLYLLSLMIGINEPSRRRG